MVGNRFDPPPDTHADMNSDLITATTSWLGYFLLFLFFGGLGAGVSAEGYELVTGSEFSGTLYAVIFGAGGLMVVWFLREERRGNET